MILVKIGKQGGKVTEYAMQDGSRVSDVLIKSNIGRTQDDIINFNGIDRTGGVINFELKPNDVIIIKERSSSGITVKWARVGEPLREVIYGKGQDLNSFLYNKGIHLAPDEEVWCHKEGIVAGKKLTLTSSILNGDILVIEKKEETLNNRVDNYLKDRYHVISNKQYTEELIGLVKRG